MDDFFVLVISTDLFAYNNISDYFEEEDQITFVDTLNNVSGDVIVLNALAADLVIFIDTWTSDKLFERICKKTATPYLASSDVEEVKEFIAERFLEWGENE